MKKIVVIGGGTGTSVVLSGLKILSAVDLTAIVSVADSGGSTGRLRDEFGFLPVGDLRQALAALATNGKQSWIRDVLLYRFSKGSGLEGHNLGNLLLTALQDMSGSTAKALVIAAQIFRLEGHIYPVTTQNVELVIEYADGTFVIGEHNLNPHQSGGKCIKRVRLSPRAMLYSKAKHSLTTADLVIIGPGDLYASIMPNLIVDGMKDTLQSLTHTKIAYIVNLMTSFTQTHKMTAVDHVKVVETTIGRPLDYIILNNAPISPAIIAAYAHQHDSPVMDDLPEADRVIRRPLVTAKMVKTTPGDAIARSFLRHDPGKIAQLMEALA